MAQAAKQLRKNKELDALAAQEQKDKEDEKNKKRNRSRDRRRKREAFLSSVSQLSPFSLSASLFHLELCFRFLLCVKSPVFFFTVTL
ncbi:hypothetical protein SKAU_G00284340 [Synaphobranchus kaupii]|uniref:Uncharacterized protein n=1 Tax=Synaphobranchus kaupii TaxID=118154 RepID=A0A9Q1IPB6_SYNKA|nr:hypothetical protein SKAU_G00284340 [Synaphobranchus kaupii]